jgi:hypothetical protein
MLMSVDGQKKSARIPVRGGRFFLCLGGRFASSSLHRRGLSVFECVRYLGRGCPLFDRPKRGRKKLHRERPGTDYRPGRSIDWSSTISRALSPFSRGRRTGRGDGMGPSPGYLTLFNTASPLSRGETWRRASCFARKDGVPLSRNSRVRVPSLEREGQGG